LRSQESSRIDAVTFILVRAQFTEEREEKVLALVHRLGRHSFALYGMSPDVAADDRLEHICPGRLVESESLEVIICIGRHCGIAVCAFATGVPRLRAISAR
jgi:hypothetical protein